MIKDLKYSVTFPTNGISLSGDLSLQPGLTAIIGDNGAGKTFGSIELTRYLMFGKKALRGPAKDYKTLEAQGTIEIQGESYTVYRGPKTEWIKNAAGETLAINAEAVTQKFIEILGFGLDVFDVVCASVQKESDKLSKMLPAARKRLIDEVIGLSSNEAVEKACREEAKALKRDADVLQDSLATLVLPVKPEGYRPSSEVKGQLDLLKRDQEQRRNLQATIDRCGPPPEHMAEPEGDLIALQDHEDARRARAAEIIRAKTELSKIPDAEWTAEELAAAARRNEIAAELRRRGPCPTMTREEAEATIAAWAHRSAMSKIGDTEVDCPECGHHFAPGADLGDEPEWSAKHAAEQLTRNDLWSTPLPDMPAGPTLSAKDISDGHLALARAGDREELLAATWLPQLEDKSQKLSDLRKAQADYFANHQAHERWQVMHDAAMAAQEALDAMPTVDGSVDDLDKAYVEARVYETQMHAYDRDSKAHAELTAVIAEKLRRSAEYKKGGEALVKARASVKAYLAPSLSRVSSALIHQMSGGVFSSMIVDEEMNVTVDGQDIATLSGAGSTVANLSLRLALGQVLVRNIFPVFIADEADADLSTSRAQFTAECLGNLKDQLDQIIIITHKEVTVADHVITR